MSKMELDSDISPSTRFAEGFYNGLKLALCHSMTFGIYYTKEEAIKKGTTFRQEYLRHLGKSTFFYSVLMSTTYGMRQLVL